MRLISCVLLASLFSACGSSDRAGSPAAPSGGAGGKVASMSAAIAELQARAELDVPRVTVRHVLIAFSGTGTRATRSREAAEQLAEQVWQEAIAGGDFGALVEKHTDDSPPGIYAMVTDRAQSDRGKKVYFRGDMVGAFGDVGWRLQVGEVGVAPFDPKKSPYGWHIVKRVE